MKALHTAINTLTELQRAGLVSPQRQGRFLYYSANFDTMHSLVEFLTANCCASSDAACIPTAVKATRKRA